MAICHSRHVAIPGYLRSVPAWQTKRTFSNRGRGGYQTHFECDLFAHQRHSNWQMKCDGKLTTTALNICNPCFFGVRRAPPKSPSHSSGTVPWYIRQAWSSGGVCANKPSAPYITFGHTNCGPPMTLRVQTDRPFQAVCSSFTTSVMIRFPLLGYDPCSRE